MEYELLKINLKKHPMARTGYTNKLCYFTILYTGLSRDNILKGSVEKLIMSYKKNFNIIDETKSDLESIFKSLREDYLGLDKSKLYIKNYRYLLIADLIYLESNFKVYDYIDRSFIKNIAYYLNITDEELHILLNFFRKLAENNFVNTSKILSDSRFGLLNYFLEKYKADFEFKRKYEKRILVMSTMSSGKSTVINSIFGQDILPSQNEVCTSKVINIIQNSSLDRVVGYAKGRTVIMESDLTVDTLNTWNVDSEYEEINIEGNTFNKFKYKKKLRFIDTPGTNNSRDKAHYNLTIETLNKGEFDIILYVLNATNLGCDDDFLILTKVVEYMSNNSHKDIIFVLNKMDEIDIESGESLYGIYSNAINYLKNTGIKEPKIITTSAYAAKLFRKALNLDDLTRKESSDFLNLYELFTDESYDLNNYKSSEMKLSYETIGNIEDGFIKIKGEDIDSKLILQAIRNTGILSLESYFM